MRRLLLVAVTAYKRRIRSGSFLLLTIGLPLLMLVASAVPILRLSRQSPKDIGILNMDSGLDFPAAVQADGRTVTLIQFDSESQAEQATRGGRVQGYLEVPSNYPSEQPVYHALEDPSIQTESVMADALRHALAPNEAEWVYQRLDDPAVYSFQALGGGRVQAGVGLIVWIATPAVLAIMFVLAVFTGASQMGGILLQERDERAMEMLVTSMKPSELVLGKVVGITLVSMTQLAIWSLGAAGALLLILYSQESSVVLRIPWGAVGWALILGVPSYLLYAVTGAGLGILAGEGAQARQLAGILGLLGMAPIWLLGVVLQQPSGPWALGLTLFPYSAVSIALFRMVFTEVPLWQLAASLAITLGLLVVSGWALTRMFRAAFLLGGQRLSVAGVWRALRGSGTATR
jgi:ABC-2 type transport system permease protein